MRNKILLFLLLLLVNFYIPFNSSTAQQFTLKIVGKSPGDLNLDYTNAQEWEVSSGLRVAPVSKRVYLSADTTEGVTSYTWSITERPDGSTAELDSSGTQGNSFLPDVTGEYTVSVTVGARTVTKDIFISTFRGITLTQDCAPCHSGDADKFEEWSNSAHGTMYKRGLTGMLAVNDQNMGLYGDYCVKCHTTGWDSTDANGNFGYVAHQTGWDTTWYRPGELQNGTIRIPQGDSSRWVRMQTDFSDVEQVASIGCESCHGPAEDHASTGNPQLVAVSLESGACNQCHDAPPGYQVGTSWKKSRHATMPLGGQTTLGRAACFPCHSGAAFVKFTKNKSNPGYNASTDAFPSVSCATCHDPHNDQNTGLRTLTLDSLANGYVPASDPEFQGGAGLLCMNCHHARENSFVKVTRQAAKFSDRFYPHYSPQADMLLGANAYEYDLDITGTGNHKFLEDACVTCHMTPKPDSQFGETNHEMSMIDEEGNERVYVCQQCHQDATSSFDDVLANDDYDGDGTVEGGQSEIQGLMDQLRAILPKDKNGEVVTMAIDSLVVKNDPNYPRNLPAIFNYNFVSHDFSQGIHNTPYAAAILQASLNQLTGVKRTDEIVPKTYALEQNFPNPFNPATTISFSIPEASVITLKVFDAVGNEIATLHRGHLTAGNYKFDWNAGNLASGVYYYRLSSDNFTQTKKMILLK